MASATDDKVEKTTSGKKLLELAKMRLEGQNEISDISGGIGEKIAAAVERNNLNKAAFGVVFGLYKKLKKDAIKGGVHLRDVLLYIEAMKLEAMIPDQLPLGDEADDEAQEAPARPNGPAATTKRAAAASDDAALKEIRERQKSTSEADIAALRAMAASAGENKQPH